MREPHPRPCAPRYLGGDLALRAAEEGGFGREEAILEVFIQAAVAAAHAAADGHGRRAGPGGGGPAGGLGGSPLRLPRSHHPGLAAYLR